MLRKMRWRVIAAAMLAFFAVILLIAVLVNVVNSYVVTSRADQTLSYILQFEEEAPVASVSAALPPAPFMELPDLESNYMTRFFIVRFGEDGNAASTYTDYIASIDEGEAVQYARKACAKGRERGYIGDFRYVRKEIEGTNTVVFLNTSKELQYMRSLRNLTMAVAAVSLLLVFGLVFLFSGKAIQPIVRNVERQKQFITDVGHELKTPLTSISTSIEVIAMERGEDEWTQNVRNQTQRMSKLVSGLVTLSKLDEEIPLPVKEHFSLTDAAWEIIDVCRPQAKACGKQINADIQDGLALFGEKTAIQQMLSVLLDNAIRYSDPESEIRLTLLRKRGRIYIEAFNTCQYDVPPDERKLFDRFYRPDSSRSTASGGTGVGLAIAKAVAEAHGGTIRASCPSGKSMTITVRI